MSEKIPLTTFINTFINSHGVDGAAELLKQTTRSLGLHEKLTFTKDEAILICKKLQNESGFVGVVAGILLTRLKKEIHE